MTAAVILAGGLGSRLRSVVSDVPKPMAPINGRPFLEHQMRYWIEQGINHFVLSVGYKHQAIIDYFGSQFETASLEYAVEESPLGTGGGLLLAAEMLDSSEYFLLLNGDTYFSVELEVLTNFAIISDADWCFSLFRTSETGRYMGVDIQSSGNITSLQSKNSHLNKLVNGGVYLVKPSSLSDLNFHLGEKISLEDDIFPSTIKLKQRIYGKEFSSKFIDIGVPEDYRRAEGILRI